MNDQRQGIRRDVDVEGEGDEGEVGCKTLPMLRKNGNAVPCMSPSFLAPASN